MRETTNSLVQIQIGGDQAFFLGIGKHVLERDRTASTETDVATVADAPAIDGLFIGDHTDGFAAWRQHALAIPWAHVVASSGVPEATIREIAELYLASKAVIACWAMGLTQSTGRAGADQLLPGHGWRASLHHFFGGYKPQGPKCRVDDERSRPTQSFTCFQLDLLFAGWRQRGRQLGSLFG